MVHSIAYFGPNVVILFVFGTLNRGGGRCAPLDTHIRVCAQFYGHASIDWSKLSGNSDTRRHNI